ncbi:MAG: HEAT repeat domain-containing protein [Acaryochloris sp. RU_4_1]|nr:HEAT repeat domain-containing protein [Acaryochloris sp. RU_4_1]NJR54159.1 HEAT repeat domain-containing protein [Acaryochloris sp. CRU_2_0]
MNQLVSVLSELEQGDFQSRWEIAKQIPDFGEAAIAALVDLLHKTPEDPELQWFIARILGEFQHPEAVIALVNLLESTQEDEVVEIAAQMLTHMGPRAIAALTSLLDKPQSRAVVVSALAQIQDVAVIPYWLSVMTDPDARLRAIAIKTLGRFHDPRIVPALLQGLQDVSAKVRQEAIAGISYRAPLFLAQDHNPVTLIQPSLQDFDLQVCQQAALALGRLATDRAAKALLVNAATTNTPVSVKLTIVEALGQIGSHQSIQFLQQLWPYSPQSLQILDDSHSVLAKAIVKALTLNHQKGLQAKSSSVLIHCLHHQPCPDQAINKAIASALGQLGTAQAIPELIGLLGTPDLGVRLHAIAALKQIAPDHAYRQLQALAQDKSLERRLKEGVAMALQEW